MVLPLDHFQGEKNAPLFPERSMLQDYHFFACLTTFERRSGLKKFPLLKIPNLKKGDCQNFNVIDPEEMPILVQGRHKRPPTKVGST